MLSLMRKHAKSWLIKFLIFIIAIVFIFYFGYSFTARRGLKMAYVNGDLISGMEYDKTYRDLLEALQKQYKDMWNDNLIKTFDLKNRALEGLISQKLISQEA
ncbi:MAG: SurA N-terminal domain-containing protein, partial [Deltaproteobacteria bacterium]|nr:SurA N-terminal domain-containing protein [Deltaproteobacteria bacterium]